MDTNTVCIKKWDTLACGSEVDGFYINIFVNMFLELLFSVTIRTNVEQLNNYSMTIQCVCINNMSLFYKHLYLLLNDNVFCD